VLGGGKTFEDKRVMVKAAMEFVSKISDKREKELFIKRIAEKTGLNEELLIKDTYQKAAPREIKSERGKPSLNVSSDLVELHLIQLMLEYPQKILHVESEGILEYFLQPELKNLGKKILDAYKLLGFIDIGIILSADENSSLRERIFQLMMQALPADEAMLGKILADNVRQIKRKWYKEQHRQIKLRLSKAQEPGNEDMINKLLYEKENILMKEKELH
jgi:DNA primase